MYKCIVDGQLFVFVCSCDFMSCYFVFVFFNFVFVSTKTEYFNVLDVVKLIKCDKVTTNTMDLI